MRRSIGEGIVSASGRAVQATESHGTAVAVLSENQGEPESKTDNEGRKRVRARVDTLHELRSVVDEALAK